MKYIFSIFLCSFFLFAHGQNLKERRFKNTVDSVIMYYTNKDSANFSRFTDTSIGIYILYHTEGGTRYTWLDALGFSASFFDKHPLHNPLSEIIMSDSPRLCKLIYATLPKDDLGEDGEANWSKNGLFVDTNRIYRPLSGAAEFAIRYDDMDIPKDELNLYKKIENNSRRIVLADGDSGSFDFYLMYKNHKWYITIINYSTTNPLM